MAAEVVPDKVVLAEAGKKAAEVAKNGLHHVVRTPRRKWKKSKRN